MTKAKWNIEQSEACPPGKFVMVAGGRKSGKTQVLQELLERYVREATQADLVRRIEEAMTPMVRGASVPQSVWNSTDIAWNSTDIAWNSTDIAWNSTDIAIPRDEVLHIGVERESVNGTDVPMEMIWRSDVHIGACAPQTEVNRMAIWRVYLLELDEDGEPVSILAVEDVLASDRTEAILKVDRKLRPAMDGTVATRYEAVRVVVL